MLEPELIKLAQKIKDTIPKGATISVAESCTGGMLAAYLTAIQGSSEYFSSGIVSYSNAAKIKFLGVKAETLEKFGAVSEETAKEMAAGCQKACQSDVAISITGIAGPDGGSKDKPVGTVCFGIARGQKTESLIQHFAGDRNQIRLLSCKFAMELLLEN